MNENTRNSGRVIRVNFEDVEVGRTAVKTIEIWNESCEEQIYQVQRDPTTNPLDHVFHLRSYTWMLAPRERHVCEIRYRPFVASSKNVDYFSITESFGTCLKLIARGSCIGPRVTCSTTKIVLISTSKNPAPKWRIKLKNDSKASAIFMIAMNEKYRPFQLDSRHGCINPCSHKYVTITFDPPEDGAYSYRLPVLILHQEPIVIYLYGYRSSSHKEEDKSYSYVFPREKNGFEGYMNDSVDTTSDLPPVSFSKNYFDFGRAEVDTENNSAPRIPQAICLTNHSQSDLLITWEKDWVCNLIEININTDIDGVFDVTPRELQLRGGQSSLFELSFNPNAGNNLFGREIVASVFENGSMDIVFPFFTSIEVIGHSFPATSNGWIPQYEIPQTVIMPACVPQDPVFTTFLMKKFGHLPLMFQFVPPPATRFTVKPILGVIHQDYQIITVKMSPKPEDEQIYLERWTIYFNGNTKNESCIDFKGYAECPNIIFLNDNVLNFAPVLPRCQQFEKLRMRNITRHKIRYLLNVKIFKKQMSPFIDSTRFRFYQMPYEFNMQTESGEIEPNDFLCQECSLQPTEPSIDYDFELICVLIVVKNETLVGLKSCVSLRVRGRCEMGSLVAIPEELYFKEIEYNNTETLTFKLFNYCPVNISYKLICDHRNWPLGNIQRDVQFRPSVGTVFSGSYEQIMISITPRTPGYYDFLVEYMIRVNSRLDTLVPDQIPVRICTVCCMCILPTIKVDNVCAYGYKQTSSLNISKPFLWKAMEIDKLNTILENILPGERKNLRIKLFPLVVNKGVVIIKLIVKNYSRFLASWTFKWIQRCNCKPVSKKIGCSLWKKELDCPHQKLCILDPMSGKLKRNKETVISMEVYYSLIGKSELSYNLDIGHDRHIILDMLIDCLPVSEKQYNFLSSTCANFGQIYFGNREAVHKAYWIWNITNNDLPYSVDIYNICKINEQYHCEVFSCLTQSGTVKARSSKPLLLKFQPRMFGTYKAVLPITLGHKTMELTLKGQSSCDFRSTLVGKSIPIYCRCNTLQFPVYFNIDCIDMWSRPMHNFMIKMLIVQNGLDQDALGFEWKCKDVSDVCEINVIPRKGIIGPHTVQSFRLEITTKGHPCRINIDVPCEFINASKKRDYQRSILQYDLLTKELAGQFVITEKGTTVPEPWLKILDEPETFSKTLSVRCSIYPVEDESIRISLTEELKTAPLNPILFDDTESYDITEDTKELFIATFILEGLLWDIVNGRRFKRTIEKNLIPKRNLYYSQFLMDLSERRRLINRCYISPPLKLIHSILEKMLFIIVHEEFSLGIAHMTPREDARHANYIRTILTQKK
ncbi:PREDICTED: uncharacterized protein LOC107193913, partial [Dufourea novaeangliae]|uniref:uncharacterized protein LOC107193913 n=1 Tax=Dufourea novaeangliae TaxID=178035 RepID=UPI00076760D2